MQAIERGNSDRNQFAPVAIRASRADKGFEIVVAVVHGFYSSVIGCLAPFRDRGGTELGLSLECLGDFWLAMLDLKILNSPTRLLGWGEGVKAKNFSIKSSTRGCRLIFRFKDSRHQCVLQRGKRRK
jgi:hypothetical protein